MRELLCLAIALASLSTICSAQTTTETFGSGANAFTMDFVTIGNPGNAADTTGNPNPVGSVAYIYNIGKYEVSRDQITKADLAGSLWITLLDMTSYGGNGLLKPATGITFYEAAKYVNWLNTSQGYQAAYKFVSGTFTLWSAGDAGYDANNMFRNSQAKYVIASRDEWYKAAYANLDGTWNDYPTGSNSAPRAVAGGTDPNTAVYGGRPGPADINNAGGLSPYGTMGQAGNVWEMVETAYDGINNTAGEMVELRSGPWWQDGFGSGAFKADYRGQGDPTYQDSASGFRVVKLEQDQRDSDADGLSNHQEVFVYGTNPNQKDTNSDGIEDGQAVTLGYSPTFNFSALISHLQSHPPTGLYTASQMQAMAIGDLVLTRDVNGGFNLKYDIEQSTDLQSWLPYQSFNQQITNLPPDKAFIRIKAKQ